MAAGHETFSSRWGIILAGLGMAVGTGNMWRFPRVAAEHGGAAFLIPWIIFLFIWSIPLLVAEFSIGRATRRGAIGAFASLTNGRFAWMGGFVALVTVMIGFYYSVVTGWTLRYVLAAAAGQLGGAPGAYWEATASGAPAAMFHMAAALIGGVIIQQGVVKGLERANRLLVPVLFVLLVVAVFRSMTLPNASLGLEFLFNPDLSQLAHYETWLQALSQSAWSTGAGFGLLLTFGIYLRREDDVTLDATTIGFGDNSASLLAGLAIVPAVFAVLTLEDAHAALGAGNEGLMFIWIPELFTRMAGGSFVMPLFFLALACAALSSLIAMIELATRILMDIGMPRRRAVWMVTTAIILFGLPSAGSLTMLQNQDWVWGVGLMISGLFISLLVTMYGASRFVADHVNITPGGLRVGPMFVFVLKYLVPVQFAVMFGWWMYQAAAGDPDWWNPLSTSSVGTCILQWGVALAVLIAFNGRMARASLRKHAEVPQ